MKETNGNSKPLAWLRKRSTETTRKLLAVLCAESAVDLAEVSIGMRTVIHNIALYNVLKVVNFPRQTLLDAQDEDDCVLAYDEFADRQSRKLLAFCRALAQWRQDESTGHKPARTTRRRGTKKADNTPADSASPHSTADKHADEANPVRYN